jgi:outer membrane protein W
VPRPAVEGGLREGFPAPPHPTHQRVTPRPIIDTGEVEMHRSFDAAPRFEPLRPLALCVLFLLALSATSVAAEEPRWIVQAQGVWLSPAGDRFTTDRTSPAGVAETTTHTVDEDATGFGVSLEARLTRRIGIELAIASVDLDNDFRVETAGAVIEDREVMGLESFSLGADWHFAPGRRADASFGAFIAQTTFDDVIFLTEAGRREKLTFDDDYGFGVKLGVDLPIRRDGPWVLSADLRYLVTIMESEIAGQDLELDPLIVSVGIGYRF